MVGRGWLVECGHWHLVDFPGCVPEAGIPVVSMPERPTATTCYDIQGMLLDEGLEIRRMRPSARQGIVDISEPELRRLGCDGRLPVAEWIEIERSWGGDTPLGHLAVQSMASAADDPDDLHTPARRILVGQLEIVRWVTEDLHRWLQETPTFGTVCVVPMIANRQEDLLPW